jgi:hypothetical protein
LNEALMLYFLFVLKGKGKNRHEEVCEDWSPRLQRSDSESLAVGFLLELHSNLALILLTPACSVTKQRDPETLQNSLLFQVSICLLLDIFFVAQNVSFELHVVLFLVSFA